MSLFLRLEIVSISNGGKAAKKKKKSKNFYVKLEEKRKLWIKKRKLDRVWVNEIFVSFWVYTYILNGGPNCLLLHSSIP